MFFCVTACVFVRDSSCVSIFWSVCVNEGLVFSGY